MFRGSIGGMKGLERGRFRCEFEIWGLGCFWGNGVLLGFLFMHTLQMYIHCRSVVIL